MNIYRRNKGKVHSKRIPADKVREEGLEIEFFFLLRGGSHVSQVGLEICISEYDLEFLIILFLPSECCNYRCVLPCPALHRVKD